MSMKVAVIGECMLELRQQKGLASGNPLTMDMSYGGDTLNTSIYLVRNNIAATYVSALGDDPMSDWLLEQWQDEGIDCSLVTQMESTVPGMYLIDVDEDGERSFYYWRENSPASRLFDDAESTTQLFEKLAGYDYLYLSGISLAILPEDSLSRLFDHLNIYRKAGGKIVFDGNYRPTLWRDVATAQRAYQRMYKMTDIALPTFEDEAMLFDYSSAEQVIESIRIHGVGEIVVKMGGEGCLAYHEDKTELVPAQPTEAIDTTAAGDSYNAGYLANRLNGGEVIESCLAGHQLASKVIQHRGAIIPKSTQTW